MERMGSGRGRAALWPQTATVVMGVRLLLVLSISASRLLAQASGDLLSEYRKLKLPEAAGLVTVMYSPAAEQRALRYQKSLTAAVAWYSEQLKTKIPVVLAVLDKDTWERVGGHPYPMPFNWQPLLVRLFGWRTSGATVPEGLVVLPAHMEDFPGSEMISRDPNLLAEAISFHEAGHIFAGVLGIGSGNQFANEVIANVFVAGFVRAGHPEFAFMTAGVPAQVPRPRYTSLVDFGLLYSEVGMANFSWFQFRLNQLAGALVEGQDFPGMIDKLRMVFPVGASRPAPVEEILGKLEKIHPGFVKAAAELAAPTTLDRVAPSECMKDAATGGRSILVLRNDTGAELSVRTEAGVTVRVPSGAFRRIQGRSGHSVTLPDGRCLVFGAEPRLAVLIKP